MSRKTLESYVPKKHGSIDYDSKAEKNGNKKHQKHQRIKDIKI